MPEETPVSNVNELLKSSSLVATSENFDVGIPKAPHDGATKISHADDPDKASKNVTSIAGQLNLDLNSFETCEEEFSISGNTTQVKVVSFCGSSVDPPTLDDLVDKIPESEECLQHQPSSLSLAPSFERNDLSYDASLNTPKKPLSQDFDYSFLKVAEEHLILKDVNDLSRL